MLKSHLKSYSYHILQIISYFLQGHVKHFSSFSIHVVAVFLLVKNFLYIVFYYELYTFNLFYVVKLFVKKITVQNKAFK